MNENEERKMSLQIGKYRVHHQGGCWHVTDRAEHRDLSTHEAKWEAVRAARMYNWRGRQQKEPPVLDRPAAEQDTKVEKV